LNPAALLKAMMEEKSYVKARGVFENPWQEVILKQEFDVSKFMYFNLYFLTN
jgi:hypothetical protein